MDMDKNAVEWVCPKCNQGYLLVVGLMEKEKKYHEVEA